MNILFLDLSSTSTGWAVGNDEGELVGYGCLPVSGQPIEKRIPIMRDKVLDIVRQFNIQKVIAEEVYDESDRIPNSQTQKKLTWLQGCIVVALYEYNPKIPVEFIYPSTWRSRVGIQTGRGIKRESLKPKDIQYVKTKYGIDANDDICDAICIHDAYYIQPKTCAF